ncbi:hypothetical protein A2867_04250 [Candidatus Daviesbacteria bacterium RIFCSPHIGHO2_01_FULL_40_11]|uniref:DUF4177 domain-containing protein n=1 Tax=Candidatus Daviesbacteria bacterium RIFCSPHIGHO2_01_FULL_40_11 TaxID=1797762 RepID=A0A1F5JJG4_9BACT|nr:MAG: hypothetical protein A2867_04250 [Candidatus Daviesbacteria bacterium RIFCSPHIGHO2_01_FULL_40_11]OGE62914.1 MAG: hypothetical protein A2964_01445 [Candidatus Daviesbacteria bacterium RIFCSPLOWO2_01_FULL_40_27]
MTPKNAKRVASNVNFKIPAVTPLWQLGIKEITGHNIESAGREVVNKLLKEGWILLHIYTLVYHEDGIWRERPMAILGKPKKKRS